MMSELKKALKEKKLNFGTDLTLKKLRDGKVKKVFLASNCPENTKKTIKYYAKLSKAEVIELEVSNEELGVLCKKPFMISVLSC
jgi:large subunit ribosomal protein L30e